MESKILLVNDYYSEGGAEGVCRKIEEIVKRRGGTISFYYGSKKYRLPDSAKEYIYSKKYYSEFKKKILEFEPDIIHLHNYYHLLSPSILKAIKDCRRSGSFNGRVVMTAHDYHLLCPDSGLYYNSDGKIVPQKSLTSWQDILTKQYDTRGWAYSTLKKVQWVYNYSILKLQDQIDTFLAPSNFLKKKYAEKFPDKQIHLVRNPYEINVINTPSKSIPDEEETLKIVFLGRVSPEKGIKEFIRSLAESKVDNYRFDIIGDGPDIEKTQELIQELHLTERIFVLGRIPYEDVLQRLTEYDALVLPSLWFENAPLVLVEAVIANIRILTSNWGGMKEIAELCGGSYLMNPLDSGSVERSMNDIYSDIYVEKKSLNRDIERITKEFSTELFIQKMTSLYSNNSA
ncbi:glycosyltransferase [Rhodohalobacter sp. 614A]|uniref:glycosyltransferase n=1 Tax=Rhodohalobacter sp. 614A TaxID=2908649 RepID=UPI001F15936D|nr:glycosyltransferase [Rhodohalobacter sp. 614A]